MANHANKMHKSPNPRKFHLTNKAYIVHTYVHTYSHILICTYAHRCRYTYVHTKHTVRYSEVA